MLGRLVAVMLVMTAVFAGCVASSDGPHEATRVVTKRHATPRAILEHVAVAPSTTLAPTTTVAPAPRVAVTHTPRAPRVAAAPAAPRPAPSPKPASPWQHYDGHLTNGNYIVARALGGGLNVSTAPDAAPAVTLSNPLPSGAPRVVLVVAQSGEWLQVLLPMRPNSSLGWVRQSDVQVSSIHYRVEIDRAAHRLQLFDGDAVVMDEPIAVGKPSTPTPGGQFFAVELLNTGNPGGAYGPYAFTLSAYSEVYQTFGSGDGAVGMHGTNEYDSVGQSASHGCVRLHNDAIERLANTLPLGTPVFIR
jgi:lipoprotein-anchoring transpeptidase ErfK/SrfK